MTNRLLLLGALWVPCFSFAQTTTAPPVPPPPPPLTATECDVYARENSFAQSVARGDLNAFAEHLHADAVFLDGPVPRRGRATVIKEWTPIVGGKDAALRWKANDVVIGADARIAYSRGPFSVEQRGTDAKPRFLIGTFSSVWVKENDGIWRVLYDGAVGARGVGSREEVDEHMARAVPRCTVR